jgi:hypothetical protein
VRGRCQVLGFRGQVSGIRGQTIGKASIRYVSNSKLKKMSKSIVRDKLKDFAVRILVPSVKTLKQKQLNE